MYLKKKCRAQFCQNQIYSSQIAKKKKDRYNRYFTNPKYFRYYKYFLW